MSASHDPLFVGPKEAAERLGISVDRCYEWITRKILRAAKDGGRYFIPTVALHRLAERIANGEDIETSQSA